MKINALAAALILGWLTCSTFAQTTQPSADIVEATTQPTTTPSIVATVNGKEISGAELDTEAGQISARYAQQVPPEQLAMMKDQIRSRALDELVNKDLLTQAADDQKISVDPDEVSKATADLLKNAPPGALEQELAQSGMTREAFDRLMTENLRFKKLLDANAHGEAVTDADAKAYYDGHVDEFKQGETVSARHILVAFADGDDDAKKAAKKEKAEAIRQRLLNGEDFAKVCAQTSDDPGSKSTGGLYEDFGRGQMVPEFENAAFTQKVGEIGPVVQTQYGYHIIKVEKHSQPTTMPLAQANDQIRQTLSEQRKQEAVQKYLKDLHEKATITYAPGFAPTTRP